MTSALPVCGGNAFTGLGTSGAVTDAVFFTVTPGVAGIAALDAQSPQTGDYGVIGNGTVNQVFLQKIAGGWFRPFPFLGGAEFAAGAISSLIEETPQSLSWTTSIPAGATIDYDTTVAGKIFFEAGSAAQASANDDQTTRTASVSGIGLILRAVTFNPGIVDTADFGSFLLNPKLGGTDTILGLQVDTSLNFNNYVLLGTAGDEDTGLQFRAESDVELYALSDGSVVCFQDWEATPTFDATVTYDDLGDVSVFARIECNQSGATQAKVQMDSQQVIELV